MIFIVQSAMRRQKRKISLKLSAFLRAYATFRVAHVLTRLQSLGGIA